MAVSATSLTTDLILVMDNGVGSSGQALSVNRTFKSVKPDATNDDVYTVAQALIGLQSMTNNAIQRKNTLELENA
jgi:hypothetical protein